MIVPGAGAHQLRGRVRAEQIGGGLVGEDRLSALVGQRDRLGEVHEHGLQTLLDAPYLREQPRVVDRHARRVVPARRRAPGRRSRRARCRRGAAPTARRAFGRGRAAARRQPSGSDCSIMNRACSEPWANERSSMLRHLRQQLRLAAADHARDRVLAVGIERMRARRPPAPTRAIRVGRRDRDLPDRAVVVAQVDHAQVRQTRHRQIGDLLHRRRQVERRRQHGARLDQQLDRDVVRRQRLLAHGASSAERSAISNHTRVPPSRSTPQRVACFSTQVQPVAAVRPRGVARASR